MKENPIAATSSISGSRILVIIVNILTLPLTLTLTPHGKQGSLRVGKEAVL